MNERKDITPFIPKSESESSTRGPSKAERELKTREVSTLDPAELFELKKYLESRRIKISQPLLQKGIVSAGYAKFGAIQLDGGKIAFIPNQNNQRIVGTPQDFLKALKVFE